MKVSFAKPWGFLIIEKARTQSFPHCIETHAFVQNRCREPISFSIYSEIKLWTQLIKIGLVKLSLKIHLPHISRNIVNKSGNDRQATSHDSLWRCDYRLRTCIGKIHEKGKSQNLVDIFRPLLSTYRLSSRTQPEYKAQELTVRLLLTQSAHKRKLGRGEQGAF